MNKNSISTDISWLPLVVRACHPRCVALYLNRYLFKCGGFYLPCVIAALLLSATDAVAATITVTNGNDSGLGSLRRAILIDASPGDTINFAPSVTTVNLTSDELIINKNLTIIGPGANRLTVQRSTNAPEFRIFRIRSSTVTVSTSGITISNGSSVSFGLALISRTVSKG